MLADYYNMTMIDFPLLVKGMQSISKHEDSAEDPTLCNVNVRCENNHGAILAKMHDSNLILTSYMH